MIVLSRSARQHRKIVVPGGASSYPSAVLADNPYAYWRLGDTSGTTAADASGNGRTGTYNNGSGSFTLNQASLQTSDADPSARLQSAYVASGFLLNTSAATVEAIVKIPVGYTGVTIAGFQDGFGSSTSDKMLGISGGAFLWYVYDGHPSGIGAPSPFTAGTAYHIAGTVGAGGQILYVNGIAVATGIATGSYTGYGTNNVFAGGGSGGGGGAAYLSDLYIDEFAVYNTQISAARILAHAQAGGF